LSQQSTVFAVCQVPLCKVIRFNIEYTIHYFEEEMIEVTAAVVFCVVKPYCSTSARCGLLLQMQRGLCVCCSRPRALQKRLNRLRCRLGYGLGWKNHLLGGGPDYPTEVVVWRYGLGWKNHLLAGGPDSPLEVAVWRYRLWWKNHLLAGGLDSPLEVEVWRGAKFCRYIYGSKRSVGLHRRLTQWRPLGGVTVKCPDSFVSLLLLRFAEFCRVTELLIERHLLPTYRTIKSACVAL